MYLRVSGGRFNCASTIRKRRPWLKTDTCMLAIPSDLVSRLGAYNLGKPSRLGFNIHVIQVSPIDWKKLMHLGLKLYGNPLTLRTSAILFSTTVRNKGRIQANFMG